MQTLTERQALEPGSYVSLEAALSLHGWAPEGVPVTASIVPGRKSSSLDHPALGAFTFHPLALHKEHFLELIERRQFGSQAAWVAKPARARQRAGGRAGNKRGLKEKVATFNWKDAARDVERFLRSGARESQIEEREILRRQAGPATQNIATPPPCES